MKREPAPATSLKKEYLAPIIVGVSVGVASNLVSFSLGGYVWPSIARWELFQRTHEKRITIYGDLMKIFPDAFFLERAIKEKQMDPGSAEKMRMELHKKYHLLLASAVPMIPGDIFCEFTETLSDYVLASRAGFSDDARRNWIDKHYDKLAQGIRKDVGADAAGKFALNLK